MSAVPPDIGDEALAREMDMLLARAGLTPIPERRAALLAGFADLRRRITLLHGREAEALIAAAGEPAPPQGPGRQD